MPEDAFEDTVPPLAQGDQEALDAGLEAGPDALATDAAAAAEALDTPPSVEPPAFTVEEGLERDVTPAAPAVAETPLAPPPPKAAPAPAKQAVAPAPAPRSTAAPAAKPTPATTPKVEQWTVQLGSFANRANAESLLARVKATGVGGFILPLTEGGKTAFRVRAGPVAGRAAADRLRQDLERTQSIRGMLVRYP